MFRTNPSGRQALNNASTSSSRQASNENSPTTIREIKSRAVGTNYSCTAKQLLANRRQAMSMEKLNSSSAANVTSTQSNNDKDKGSPTNVGNSRLTGSASPSRGVGLNRTASRVSRFRSAKAVFERLSNVNNNANKISDKSSSTDSPKSTVASRYAAAAAARAASITNPPNANVSPRSRAASGSLARFHESGKSSSNIEINRFATKPEPSQPKPQPRVVSSRVVTPINSNNNNFEIKNSNISNQLSVKNLASQAKPPPKDLIDKIVFEIARDAGKQDPDVNCTIQDLSNCDISGIPETLDFDRCFQDVEMMTEEEARKLLSRKSTTSPLSSSEKRDSDMITEKQASPTRDLKKDSAEVRQSSNLSDSSKLSNMSELDLDSSSEIAKRNKVRFSEELVEVFDTHAVEDYDRRNDDIDPVAASAEYEIEKSKEREGICDSDNDDDKARGRNSALEHDPQPIQCREIDSKGQSTDHPDNRDYIESLEREVGLKRILEQNLRDLQSQYYSAVKELDEYKSGTEQKISELKTNLTDLNSKFDNLQNELSDEHERSSQLEKKLNDIKESSQIIEKKYHRAKKIIKDMQSREQSFNRREQLYQQKLDEIEHELGVLIESTDRTICEDGLKFFSVADTPVCQRQHRTKLDVFGLIRQALNNFRDDNSTQNPQIKQRVVSILEQKLAQLMSSTGTSTGEDSSATLMKTSASIDNPQLKSQQADDSNRHSQSYQLASHRLSQPNLPHPIGVGGQPTKLFHNINAVGPNKPSPPQSVNSYPSNNSLNSLNNSNTNNNNNNINNNNIISSKLSEHPSISDYQLNVSTLILPSTASTNSDDKFQPVPDIQMPYQTNEWHDKPVSEWTTTQVSTWLLALGLDQYISKFEDRNVNGQSLINLDSTVLKGLGVLNSNDRNLLKKKIRELRNEMERERKLIEKKMKENLKDKSKGKINSGNKHDNGTDVHQNKPSWKRGLLS